VDLGGAARLDLRLAYAIEETSLLLLVFGGLVFLFPLAAYCLFLAMVNGRQTPTMISGPWDFAGVLFATSGFLLVGGPVILGAFHDRFRLALAQGQLPGLSVLGGEHAFFWYALWGLYFALVVGGAVYLLNRRRNMSVIYNIQPGLLDEALAQVGARLKLEYQRVGNRVSFGPAAPSAEASEAVQPAPRFSETAGTVAAVGERSTAVESTTVLELEPFAALCNITLHWRPGHDELRSDVEAELARELLTIGTDDNPAASWFLTVASCLFGALLLGLIAFILMMWRGR
jgi:hypothetical protein